MFRQDGATTLVQESGDLRSMMMLTGPDMDPVYSITSDQDYIYTGCRDGLVRRYCINSIVSLEGRGTLG